MNLARLEVIGRIGNIDERTFEHNGEERTVTQVSIAVNRSYTNKDGEKDTDWFRVDFWNGLAKSFKPHAKVGRLLWVEGSAEFRNWTQDLEVEADDSTFVVEVPRSDLHISAEKFRWLDSKPETEEPAKPTRNSRRARAVSRR